jgi:hypothetical protein
MDTHQKRSLVISAVAAVVSVFALVVSGIAAYFQYQSRQDTVEERVKVELKMLLQNSPLSPQELRMISGVNERKDLKTAILVTNMGATTARITEVGYQDYDLPKLAFYSGAKAAKVLSPGEQALFVVADLVKIDRQLTGDIVLGENTKATIFATSTKGKRFETPAIIEVAK